MEEYDLLLYYIEDKNNVFVDCFSQLPIMEQSVPMEDSTTDTQKSLHGMLGTFPGVTSTRHTPELVVHNAAQGNVL